jgi:hypothetical protein
MKTMKTTASILMTSVVVGTAVAHMQMLSPMPRNTIDRNLPQWKGGRFGNDTCERTPPQNKCWGDSAVQCWAELSVVQPGVLDRVRPLRWEREQSQHARPLRQWYVFRPMSPLLRRSTTRSHLANVEVPPHKQAHSLIRTFGRTAPATRLG